MKLDQINLGETYCGTMPETVLRKRAGGYYTGYARKETGRICKVEFRVDLVRHETLWGSWVEICGTRRSVKDSFTIQMLDEVGLAVEK